MPSLPYIPPRLQIFFCPPGIAPRASTIQDKLLLLAILLLALLQLRHPLTTIFRFIRHFNMHCSAPPTLCSDGSCSVSPTLLLCVFVSLSLSTSLCRFHHQSQPREERPSSWPTSSSMTRTESRNMGLFEEIQRHMGEKSRSRCPRRLLRPHFRSGGRDTEGRCAYGGTATPARASCSLVLAWVPTPVMRCCRDGGDDNGGGEVLVAMVAAAGVRVCMHSTERTGRLVSLPSASPALRPYMNPNTMSPWTIPLPRTLDLSPGPLHLDPESPFSVLDPPLRPYTPVNHSCPTCLSPRA